MPNSIEANIDQVETLARIARLFGNRGLTLYRVSFDYLAFGSWELEAGTPHRRLQILRDGRERTLRYATARVHNEGAFPEWEEHETIPFEAVSSQDDLERWLEAVADKYNAAAKSR